MEMVLDVGFGISLETTGRLMGINAPEVRGRTRRDGERSRDWLKASLDGATAVYVETVADKVSRQKGKYGRWLVTVWADGVNLNDEIVRLGHAKKARY
jgi:micrococcal nuclease|tara:strand:+ start:9059 stop:9352 length:294 start_codon:yes stop_codon:yes gene_type:complete